MGGPVRCQGQAYTNCRKGHGAGLLQGKHTQTTPAGRSEGVSAAAAAASLTWQRGELVVVCCQHLQLPQAPHLRRQGGQLIGCQPQDLQE